MRKVIALAPVALLCGCQTIVTTPPADCGDYIPVAWQTPIAGAPLPAETDTVDEMLKEWMKHSVAQAGQLSKANGKYADADHIWRTCEAKANKARPRKNFLGIL